MRQPSLVYRPDIDGLRAVAVLAVVAYHAAPGWLPGGFIGVDVFFVISGFLITRILAGQLAEGRWSLADFYARRIRRIFPALGLVLLASLAAGWWLLLPGQLAKLGQHGLLGAGFVANIGYWLETGYFDALAQDKPLLHLWSLGVEEQFYLVWPLLMWAAWRRGVGLRTLALGLAGLSLLINIVGVSLWPSATFYLPPARLWELLTGAVLALSPQALAFLHNAPSRRTRWLAHALAGLGAGLLLAGFVWTSAADRFPGWWALLPVGGAAALVAAGPNAWINRRVLSQPWMVGCGLISFSLYLWHWPLLSFLAMTSDGPPSRLARLAAVALSIGLAWLSWRWVEQPLRHGPRLRLKTGGMVLTMVGIAAGAGALWASQGAPGRYPGGILMDESVIERERLAYWADGEWDRGFDSKSPKVLVFGDSQGFDVFKSLALDGRLGIKNIQSNYDCTAFDLPIVGKESQADYCQTLYQQLFDGDDLARADLLIYTYSWAQHDMPPNARTHFEQGVAALRAANPRLRIVFMGPKPLLGHRWVSINTLIRDQKTVTGLNDYLNSIRWIRQPDIDYARQLAGQLEVDFVDAAQVYCLDQCVFYQDGAFAYFDQNHWTSLGAQVFLDHFKQSGEWARLFGLTP